MKETHASQRRPEQRRRVMHRQVVGNHDVVVSIYECTCEVRTDETRTASDENSHALSPSIAILKPLVLWHLTSFDLRGATEAQSTSCRSFR
jgi:hypothetical protein